MRTGVCSEAHAGRNRQGHTGHAPHPDSTRAAGCRSSQTKSEYWTAALPPRYTKSSRCPGAKAAPVRAAARRTTMPEIIKSTARLAQQLNEERRRVDFDSYDITVQQLL